MDTIQPFDFDAAMAAAEQLPAAAATAGTADSPTLTPVRYFTKAGIEQVEDLLKTIRTDKMLHKAEVEALLEDPMYAKELPGDFALDRTRVFATKLELCDYFIPLFGRDFLEQNRRNAGLWTWIALAYYSQFVKTKGAAVSMTTNARWIYDPEIYRLGRRHFIFGMLALYVDFGGRDRDLDDLLFSGPVLEWSRIIDVLTYIPASMRSFSFMKGAAMLYYAPKTRGRVKPRTFDKSMPGNMWEYQRVFGQLRETWDFSGLADAKHLLEKLPQQFNGFKHPKA